MPLPAPVAGTPGWAVAIAAALVFLVPVMCWAALQVNATYVKILDDHSHMRSSLHGINNTLTAVQGQLMLTKRIAEENHDTVQTLAGGGAALPIQPLAQADAELPTGGIDPAWASDCGETCVAMLVAAKKGVPIGIARIRYLLGKPSTDGRTTGSDLVRALALCHIPAHDRATDVDACITEVVRNLSAGRSSIVLGNWINPAVPHWMLAISSDAGGVLFDDPWIGAQRYLTYQQIRQNYDGEYVHVDE